MKIKKPEQLEKADRLRNVEKIALWLTTFAVFFAFYVMMNPYLFVNIAYAGDTFTDTSRLAMIYGICTTTIWSFVVMDVLIHLIRLFLKGETEKLMTYSKIMVCVVEVLIAAFIFTEITSLIASFQPSGSTGTEVSVSGGIYAIFVAVENIISYGFDIYICYLIGSLIEIVKTENAKEIVRLAGKLSSACCASLGISVALAAIVNLTQLIFMSMITNLTVSLNLPLISIGLTLLALLVSRLIVENKKLRDDSSLFI